MLRDSCGFGRWLTLLSIAASVSCGSPSGVVASGGQTSRVDSCSEPLVSAAHHMGVQSCFQIIGARPAASATSRRLTSIGYYGVAVSEDGSWVLIDAKYAVTEQDVAKVLAISADSVRKVPVPGSKSVASKNHPRPAGIPDCPPAFVLSSARAGADYCYAISGSAVDQAKASRSLAALRGFVAAIFSPDGSRLLILSTTELPLDQIAFALQVPAGRVSKLSPTTTSTR